jgi:type IV secretory pathway TraG/TraD family ATPase VirD4
LEFSSPESLATACTCVRGRRATSSTICAIADSRHVLIEAPTRAGKGVNSVVRTLLAWRHSALVYDLKRELWRLTAGATNTGRLCLKFSPTDADDPGIRYEPLDDVRLGSYGGYMPRLPATWVDAQRSAWTQAR